MQHMKEVLIYGWEDPVSLPTAMADRDDVLAILSRAKFLLAHYTGLKRMPEDDRKVMRELRENWPLGAGKDGNILRILEEAKLPHRTARQRPYPESTWRRALSNCPGGRRRASSVPDVLDGLEHMS